MQQISQRVLRLSLIGSLLALLTFNVGTTQAAACGIATFLPAGTDCTMSIPSITPGVGTLTYSADAALTVSNIATGTPPLVVHLARSLELVAVPIPTHRMAKISYSGFHLPQKSSMIVMVLLAGR